MLRGKLYTTSHQTHISTCITEICSEMDRRPQKPTGVFDVIFLITWYEKQYQLLSNYLSGSARTFEYYGWDGRGTLSGEPDVEQKHT